MHETIGLLENDNIYESPLQESHHLLKSRKVVLNGSYNPTLEVQQKINKTLDEVRSLLSNLNLGKNKDSKYDSEKEISLFISALEYSLLVLFKVLTRANKRTDLNEEELWEVVFNMQDMMSFVLSLQSKEIMKKSTFTNASKLSCYWSGELKDILSDENIAQVLDDSGINMDYEVNEILSDSKKLHFAVRNICDPIDRIKSLAEHMNTTLSDKNISKVLKEAGIDIGYFEIGDIFTRSIKIRIAVGYISDPTIAIRKVAKHMSTTLSDENINQVLKDAGIDIGCLEIKDIFTKSLKLQIAIGYISDPTRAIKKIANHMSTTLSDENINQVLKEAGIDMGCLEIKDIFTKSLKLQIAIGYISDPTRAIKKIANHMSTTLSDENINQVLKDAGIDMGDLKISYVFSKRIKIRLALGYISNPHKAVERIAIQMSKTLSDENITEKLKEANILVNELNVSKIFSKSIRLHLAVGYISDPLDACVKYMNGEIKIEGKTYKNK